MVLNMQGLSLVKGQFECRFDCFNINRGGTDYL